MTGATGPGWYRDPSGIPGKYRWWDGRQWTHALADDAGAPPPVHAPPVRPEDQTTSPSTASSSDASATPGAAPSEDRSAGGTQQPSPPPPAPQTPAASSAQTPPSPPTPPAPQPVPPPAGAPGPDYVPPTWQPAPAPPGPPPEVLASSERGDRENLRSAIIVGVVVLALLAGGLGAWWWLRPADEPVAVESPSPEPTSAAPSPERREPTQGASPTDAPSPEPSRSDPSTRPSPSPEERRAMARLVFDPLPGNWKEDPTLGGFLPGGTGQTQVTETYSEDGSWRALAVAGYIPGVAAERSSARQKAEAVSAWFRQTGFSQSRVRVEPLESKATTIDGHDGHLLRQRFHFRIDGLKATSEEVTIVVVDLGEGVPAGVFIGSVPNTHAKLSDDIATARDSLRVVG